VPKNRRTTRNGDDRVVDGGIAHDLNNMLSIIVGSLELIRRRVERKHRQTLQNTEVTDGAQRSAADAETVSLSRKQPLV
jgi:hypothetical protein